MKKERVFKSPDEVFRTYFPSRYTKEDPIARLVREFAEAIKGAL